MYHTPPLSQSDSGSGLSARPRSDRRPARSARLLGVAAATLLVSQVGLVAQDVQVNPIGRGVIHDNDTHTTSYSTGTGDSPYYIGNIDGTDYRPFFVFDIPEAPEGMYVASASLRLFVPPQGIEEADGGITVQIRDAICRIAELETLDAFYDDLGGGPVFGSRVYEEADEDTFTEIQFNAAGIELLNRALGLKYTFSLNSDKGLVFGIFGRDNFTPLDAGDSQLVITWGGGSDAPKGSIAGTAYDDRNGNGIQDADEPGVAGVTVYLDLNVDGTYDQTTVSDANGDYEFTDLTPGLQYQVCFDELTDFEFTRSQDPAYVRDRGTYWDSDYYPFSSTTGDFNGDGNPDVFSVNTRLFGDARQFGSIVYGLGDGRFSVAQEVLISEGSTAISIAAEDFDLDGKDDVVVGLSGDSNTDSVGILFSGQGPLSLTQTVGSQPESVQTGKLDGDAYPDIVTANVPEGSISVLLFDGTSLSLQQTITDFAEPGGAKSQELGTIALGDFNGDMELDLIVGTGTSQAGESDPSSLSLSLLLGDGTGGFGAPMTIQDVATAAYVQAVSIFPRSTAAGDFNDDGNLDAIISGFGGIPALDAQDDPHNIFVVALGDGAGGFSELVTTDLGRYAAGSSENNTVTVGDLNGDISPDVVTSAGRVYFGDGSGGFEYSRNVPDRDSNYRTLFGLQARVVGIADFNGDGGSELVTPNTQDPDPENPTQLFVVEGYGVGGCSPVITLRPGEIVDSIDQGLVSLALDFEKFVNGEHVDNPSDPLPLAVGAPVVYTYVIRNDSDFDLGTLLLVDDNGTPLDPSDDLSFQVIDGDITGDLISLTSGDENGNMILDRGETWMLTADEQTAIEGLVTNTARVLIDDIDRAVDTASYEGLTSAEVEIDWKPGSNPSAINLKKQGTTPVAILGSSTFDVSAVDIASLWANDVPSESGPGVSLKGNSEYQASYDDVNGDGFLDLVLHFENTRLRSVLLNDSGSENGGQEGETLYLFGFAGEGVFIGVQQAGDPIKFIGK